MVLNDLKSFTVEVEGSVTKQNYSGLFKIKPLLSHRDKLRKDEVKRQLLGPQPDAANADSLRTAIIFSKIWAHLQEAPSWWRDAGNGLDLLDEEPVAAVIDKIVEIEDEIMGKVTKTAEEAKKDLQDLTKKKD